VESIHGYPMGRLSAAAASRAVSLGGPARADALTWWRTGVALEIYGALDAALQLTLEHLKTRRQFGRALGSFQAIQHRLAMDATAVQACRWLAIRAAGSGSPADAAIAAGYAQTAAKTVIYDLHQFSGAMGLTLEYPLHLFTYRAKLLQSELGGGRRQLAAAADQLWPQAQTA
jgi:alkylation response protein AidB-like acyl-CoA dehydrogenase